MLSIIAGFWFGACYERKQFGLSEDSRVSDQRQRVLEGYDRVAGFNTRGFVLMDSISAALQRGDRDAEGKARRAFNLVKAQLELATEILIAQRAQLAERTGEELPELRFDFLRPPSPTSVSVVGRSNEPTANKPPGER